MGLCQLDKNLQTIYTIWVSLLSGVAFGRFEMDELQASCGVAEEMRILMVAFGR